MARGGQASLEFVQIEGHVVRPGQGDSPPPWFRATVPSVDVDWEGHSAKADEEGEFDRSILLPLTTNEAQHKVVLIQTPKDDSGLVRPDLKIEWQPADGSFRVWEGGTQWQSGRVIDSRQVASWPVRLRVEPLAAVSDLIIKVTGTADENGSKATDAIRGKIVNVDLDVDADNDGTIGDADDPLEETPGGLLATGTLKRIGLKMEPAWVTGTLKLTAEAGGSRIRVWRDAGKSVPLALPAEWTFTGMGSAVPSSLYVEGLSASSAARDVQLRLRFTDDEGQTLDDSVRLTVVKVDTIKYRVGTEATWKEFVALQKILFGKETHFLATDIHPSGVTLPAGMPTWQGTFGASGTGIEVSHTYSGSPSNSDTDSKTVTTSCGPSMPRRILVCTKVLGIHSNVHPDAGFTDGHAWISITDYSSGTPLTVTYGIWGNKPRVIPGSDVHVNLESSPSGRHNRYYLLSPSQYSMLVSFVSASSTWGYTHTCANWAEDGYHAATGETVDSSDWVLFGTPRAIAGSIATLETAHPTTKDMPLDGGEDASSTSTGSSWEGSSFP
jgi:hypothetical protein